MVRSKDNSVLLEFLLVVSYYFHNKHLQHWDTFNFNKLSGQRFVTSNTDCEKNPVFKGGPGYFEDLKIFYGGYLLLIEVILVYSTQNIV